MQKIRTALDFENVNIVYNAQTDTHTISVDGLYKIVISKIKQYSDNRYNLITKPVRNKDAEELLDDWLG